jgi:hypothetical protein
MAFSKKTDFVCTMRKCAGHWMFEEVYSARDQILA